MTNTFVMPALSRRERQVATLYAEGWPRKTIALALVLSMHTIDGYLKRIRAKCREAGFEVGNALDLARLLEEDRPHA